MRTLTRRSILAGLFSSASGPVLAGWQPRFQPAVVAAAVLPIVATIPAHYQNTIVGTTQSAPLPAFSIGPNATPLMLDSTLIQQGGTGQLTDALIDAKVTSGDGIGDSAGFAGVVAGSGSSASVELMLVNYMDYRNRTSGAARIMKWVQTLGQQTVVQNIMLTLDASQARVWNGNVSNKSAASGWQSNGIVTVQSDWSLVTGIRVPQGIGNIPSGWPGLSYFVGCPDAVRIAGLKPATLGKPGWGGGKYPDKQTIHPDLALYFRTNTQGNGDPQIAGAPVGTNAHCSIVALSPPTGAQLPIIIEGFDFSEVQVGVGIPGYKFKNCYFGANYFARWVTFPGMNFTLLNCRVGDGGDTDRTHMYIDNIDALLAFHTQIGAANGMGIYGRAIYPSAPVYFADQNNNPFGGSAVPTLLDVATNPTSGLKYIKLSFAVPTTGFTSGLPVGLNCNLGNAVTSDSRNPAANGMGINTSGITTNAVPLLAVYAPATLAMEACTMDGRTAGAKFTYSYNDTIAIACPQANSGFGPADDGNGNHMGFLRSAVINSNQDCLGMSTGMIEQSALISRQFSNGSHVDGNQTLGTPATFPGLPGVRAYLIMRYNTICNVQHYAKATDLIDPIVNGQSTNPYAVAFGTNTMKIGGLDAGIFFEWGKQSGGAPNYGDMIAYGNLITAQGYVANIGNVASAPAVFSVSNPAAVLLNTNNAPGYGPTASGQNGLGTQVAFMAYGTLPSAIVPHKLYTIIGYALWSAGVLTNNSMTGLAVGDVLVVTSGTTVSGGLGAATFTVTAVDANGAPTALAVLNPGQYTTNVNGSTFNLAVKTAANSSASGTLTASAFASGNYTCFTLKDPVTGQFVDTSAGPASSGASFKAITTGLVTFHDNFISDAPANASYYMNRFIKDAQGIIRPEGDNVSVYNNRWLYGAPPVGTPSGTNTISSFGVDAGTGATDGPFTYFTTGNTLRTYQASVNAPPTAITTLAASAATSTTIRVTFAPDPNVRLSPDGTSNASGYQYVIRQSGGAWPVDSSGAIVWSNLPAVSVSGSNVATVLPDTVAKGQSYDIMVRGVNCYDSPNMNPMQVAANSNIPSVLMPAA